MWTAYRYLIEGRTEWEIIWLDLSIMPDPRAFMEQKIAPKLGRLVGFERVPGVRPLTGKEAMAALG